MKEINYTFIIPHHNCPDLLNRCLNSIPYRDDIQIIVVDDNSDEGKKPVECGRPKVEYIYISKEESKGAGRARNKGLERARGKWLMFPDADDFYAEGFLDELAAYQNEDVDIVYFGYYNNYNVASKVCEDTPYNAYIEDYLKKPSSSYYQNNMKYGISAAWNKVFRRDFILNNGLTFEEIFAGNDIRFVHTAGSLTNRITAFSSKLYFYVKNPNSITYKKVSFKRLLNRTYTAAAHIRFIQDQGAWNIANYSWPALSSVYSDYGIVATFIVVVYKLKLYTPAFYVKRKAKKLTNKPH